MSVPVAVIHEVLQYETSFHRFEQYCTTLLSTVEGTPVLVTSQSWDLGRDGRDARGAGIFVAATLDDHITKSSKVSKDLARLQQWARPTKVYVCSSQPISELQTEKLAEQAKQLVTKNTKVVVHGSIQLADLDEKLHHDGSQYVAERLYPAEVNDWKKFVEEREEAGLEDAAMRLALVAMDQNELGRVRRSLYEVLLLDLLAKGGPSTRNEITASLQQTLRLGKPLPPAAIEAHLAALVQDGLVEQGERLSITDQGREARRDRTTAAFGNLLQGREAVRKHLAESLDVRLTDDEFGAVWAAIEDRLSALLYLRGESVVASVSALVEGQGRAAPESVEEFKTLVGLLASAAAQAWQDVSTREDMETAVTDMFTEGVGSACDWLVGICGAFVMLCSIGLEAHSGAALRKSLASLELILDTDVALSLIGEGEPDHPSVKAARDQWVKIGGTVCLVPPVAKEFAHHAWISQVDYDKVRTWLPGTAADRALLIRNVFARAFGELLEKRKVRRRDWGQYIRSFRGRSEKDVSRARLVLTAEEHLSELRPEHDLSSPISARFLRATTRELNDAYRAGEHDKFIALDKAKRDAEIVAIVAKRRELRQRQGEGSCCLVTSARRLLRLSAAIVKDDPGAPWVISPAAWVALLSFVPGVHLSLPAMRAFLFELEVRPRLKDEEQVVLRAIKDAGEYRFGYARRGTLKKRLEDAVIRTAREMGVKRSDVVEMVQDPKKSEESTSVAASVISEALREMAVESETEKRLRQRVADLEAEVARLKR